MHREVFDPLGMRDSRFVWNPNLKSRTATGFYEDGKALRPDDLSEFKYPIAAATLYTTLDDYSRFVKVLISDDKITRQMFSK